MFWECDTIPSEREVTDMSIGERIRFFRRRKGLTQAELGEAMSFAGTSANVRVAQYEWNRREPKRDVIEQFAEIFDVAPEAIQSPDIDTKIGLMHTLFQMEDLYWLTVTSLDGYICLKQDINHPKYNKEVADDLRAWYVVKNKLTTGIISKEEYDEWRYKYPMLREDAENKDGYYYNQYSGAQAKPMEVRDNTAIYSEDDLLKILQLYNKQQAEKETKK